MPKTTAIVPVEQIESRILLIRGHKVILDSDLAELYDVPTKRLNEQVKRNHDRFLFQLTPEETVNLRSQIATSKQRRGGRRYRPYAFTEHGAIMAASVLNTHRAIEVSVYVVRAFVKLREMLRTHKELAQKLSRKPRELEIDVCKQSGLPSRNIEGLNKNEGSQAPVHLRKLFADPELHGYFSIDRSLEAPSHAR